MMLVVLTLVVNVPIWVCLWHVCPGRMPPVRPIQQDELSFYDYDNSILQSIEEKVSKYIRENKIVLCTNHWRMFSHRMDTHTVADRCAGSNDSVNGQKKIYDFGVEKQIVWSGDQHVCG